MSDDVHATLQSAFENQLPSQVLAGKGYPPRSLIAMHLAIWWDQLRDSFNGAGSHPRESATVAQSSHCYPQCHQLSVQRWAVDSLLWQVWERMLENQFVDRSVALAGE